LKAALSSIFRLSLFTTHDGRHPANTATKSEGTTDINSIIIFIRPQLTSSPCTQATESYIHPACAVPTPLSAASSLSSCSEAIVPLSSTIVLLRSSGASNSPHHPSFILLPLFLYPTASVVSRSSLNLASPSCLNHVFLWLRCHPKSSRSWPPIDRPRIQSSSRPLLGSVQGPCC
jgi:hypothetical protein